jgi:hypothetical protein
MSSFKSLDVFLTFFALIDKEIVNDFREKEKLNKFAFFLRTYSVYYNNLMLSNYQL